MKSLKRDLAAMLNTLKSLTRKTERMQRKLRAVERSLKLRVAEGDATRRRARGQRRAMQSASNTYTGTAAITAVFGIIRRSRKGVRTEQIVKKTGFNEKKIWNVINRLKSQGLVRNAQKGIYVKN